MRPSLIIILLLNTVLSFAQNFVYPTINEKKSLIKDFVPPGWTILDSTTGDLNRDNHFDAVLILQHIDSVLIIEKDGDFEDSIVTHPRILVILFKNTADNLYHLVEQSNTFILTNDDPFADDPFQSISIKKGELHIDFYWYPTSSNWFNSKAYKFRYQEKNFVLIRAEYEESNKATHDYKKYSYNFLTSKRVLTKGNWDKKTARSEPTVANFGNLKTIESLKRPGNWEVENGINL